MRTLINLWRLLDGRQRRLLVALQVVSVLMAASTVSGIAAVLPFFTVLAEPDSINSNRVLHFFFEHLGFSSERDFVIALGMGFSGIVVLGNIINFAGSMAMYRFSFRVGDAFQAALFDEYLRRDYGFHSQCSSSTLSSNVLFETARISGGILQNGLIFVTNLVTVIFVVGSIIVVNPLVAFVAATALGVSYTTVYVVARGRLLRNGLAESRYFAQRNKIMSESFGAIKEIIVMQAQSFFACKFAQCCKSISKSLVSTIAISQSPRHGLEIATVCGLVWGALYLSGRGDGAGQWIAQLSFIGLAAYRLLPALQQAFTAIVRIRADHPAFESIGVDLRLARALGRGRVGSTPVIDSSWRGRPRHEIRLDAVSFRHTVDRPYAISDITLRIPSGATVGLVGANGSGKTTLVDVLTGLLVPQTGHVEVDGITLDTANRDSWRSIVAYVPQQIFLLDSTFAENIALGFSTAQIDAKRLHAAVRLAQLEECVAMLPNRYDEVLGERGCRLSGGQRQRLGIARALYRGASVLIMDEATSALDVGAEQEIVDMLVTLGQERTILMIAHRLSSLRHCDLIFELENGRIVRSGNYRHLLAPTGMAAANAYQDRHTAR
jgi:ABC-type multidrug transport system fused ATPase/permease subunit